MTFFNLHITLIPHQYLAKKVSRIISLKKHMLSRSPLELYFLSCPSLKREIRHCRIKIVVSTTQGGKYG